MFLSVLTRLAQEERTPDDEWEAKGGSAKATNEPRGAYHHDNKTTTIKSGLMGKNLNKLTFRRIWGGVA